MRVVSGSLKGKGLKAVPGNSTRPTTDKVKEAIFNMVGPYFSGGLGLDLFAGSGGLGIEGLSRGLDKVIFVDLDRKAIQTIYDNLRNCKLEERAEVYRNEASRALKAIYKRELCFDYIFLDPPYKKQQLIKLMEMIDESNLLKPDGTIVCEHGVETKLPEKIGRYKQIRHEEYGIIGVTVYTYKVDKEGEM
ncbi:16S rRNA (guanine(966)-N(2))-methyltransferase RsmD [Mesobacillus maritimus]|uniref:16S rRNA (guanine(966)-N(2))-methyltransferase RsmD n=1 Tax=Mesobacillus maritimus TaxID=1643336 RepID=UPI00203B4B77|nr:16S rRNA (guanine(966)-N(2))-methyltransferase RsmD [Mesobacillus maritimus]MCM3587069.1 16S rRNA (guanine(966)-N(2))-methyltransferase RsmD [Mesobacillus maritimus]MCM3667634.1 16S rRNA (guanine(966)-N(2))-methyltransferase RsmD [Mesobacillus maritimus]